MTNRAARILVADADPLALRFVASLLRQQGHEVRETGDGEETLRAVLDQPPRLVILDLVLPGKDGYEVLEALKKDPVTRRLPVLVLSVRSREEDIVKALRMGAEDFVAKPFNAQELLLRVGKILDRTW
jgi:DNA-binding response OmpR family regulator